MIPTPEEILLKLTSFDRQNYDDASKISDTTLALEYVADLLDSQGIKVKFQEYERRGKDDLGNDVVKPRKNLVANVHDREGLPAVCFEGHIDTVPFGDYKGNPLGEEREGRIYGRGVVDMSGSLSGMIYAALQARGIHQPTTNVQLVITSDEEAYKFEGIKRFLQDNPISDLAVCGEPTSMAIKDRFKGALYYILNVKGRSGHGSRQHEGENAIAKGLPILNALIRLYEAVPEIVNPVFASDDEYSKRSSMNIGIIRAGTKVNTIPDSMKIEFEMRLVYPAEKYHRLIAEALAPYQDIMDEPHIVFAENPVVPDISASNPFYDKLHRLSDKRIVSLGFSEANFLNNAGIPTVEWGVGDNSMSHTDEEYVGKKDLMGYITRLLELVR